MERRLQAVALGEMCYYITHINALMLRVYRVCISMA